ncbi:LysM peptidoglycan-binding domain-containing protein [Heyndrickxia acidicola]|uniref:LysM domain-containing protein n=1 Tax=Heyndrickxia acidicola TaxID=209389 RepID=A0ABU6MKJ1_9BACI|nr:LysM domain-containing protein [Heyndrickxia acidicola]MED1204907.1 LysM domain-containing protein [Heyndrickxia acidicola]
MEYDPYQERMEKMRQKADNNVKFVKLEDQTLPTRREYHQMKKQKLIKQDSLQEDGPKEENEQKQEQKPSLGFPLLRGLLVFFILLPITVFFAYTYFSSHPKLVNAQKDNGVGVEISYDNHIGGGNTSSTATASSTAADSQKKKNQVLVKKSDESSKPSEKSTQPVKKPEEKLQPVKIAKPINRSPNKASAPSKGSKDSKALVLYHQVKPKETLFSIAMKYYHSQAGIATIEKWNKIGPNGIQSGQTLKIVIGS